MFFLILVTIVVVLVGLVLFKNYSLSNQVIKDRAAIHSAVSEAADEVIAARTMQNPVLALASLSRAQGRLKTLFGMYSVEVASEMTDVDLSKLVRDIQDHEAELRQLISDLAPDFQMDVGAAAYMAPLRPSTKAGRDDEPYGDEYDDDGDE